MRKTLFLALSLILSACNATEPRQQHHLGLLSQQQLLAEYVVFAKEYQAYQPSPAELKAVSQLQGKSLLILFGTWCHDSERELPRLLKLLEQSQVTLASLKLVAVDYKKTDPLGLHKQYDLRYTPTFILLDGEKVLGKVVERPVKSLGEDLADLL